MAHVRMNERWEKVMDDFERNYPELVEEVSDWYPINHMEMVVILKNGRRMVYSFIGNMVRPYHDPEKHNIVDEDEWRMEFANRLNKKMRDACMSQYTLSERTGISLVTLSKYMNGKATPSCYNLDRISRAFKCSSSEFTNIL